jgi:RNase P subunit RPR2
LPEYDWGPSSGSQSTHFMPAGQVDGVHEEEWYSTAQNDLGSDGLDHSLQHNNYSQVSDDITEASDITTTIPAQTTIAQFMCQECNEAFSKPHLLNKHMKKHYPPFSCDECGKAFRYRKDLTRHCKSKHPETVEESEVLFCPYFGCKFSAEKCTGSSRRDNLNRHIQTQHE